MNSRAPESSKKAASAAQIPLDQFKQPPWLNKRNILTVICLLDQDVLQRSIQQLAQRIEVIYRGQMLAAQPFVDGPGRLEAEEGLQRADGNMVLFQQLVDVLSGRVDVDLGKGRHSFTSADMVLSL